MGSPFEVDEAFVRFSGEKPLGEQLNDVDRKIQVDSSLFYLPDPETAHDGYNDGAVLEVFPSDVWCQQLLARHAAIGHKPSLVYTTLDAALLVSWALCGNLETAHVKAVPRAALPLSLMSVPMSEVAFMASNVEARGLMQVSETLLRDQVGKVQRFVWTQATLFLDDMSAQSLAAKYLFQIMAQREAESFLVAHLRDPDPDVRFNVLNALSLSTYSVGFVPGASLPPRSVRLEPAALSVSTIRAILALAATEQDQGVLDGIINTLSAQPFEGSLRAIADEVCTTLVGLTARVRSEQSARDAREIVRAIRKIAE